jgi:hypothetical protein
VWCEDNGFLPSWSHIDCVMTTWKSRVRSGTVDPKMRIPTKQISIINMSLRHTSLILMVIDRRNGWFITPYHQ